MRATRFQTAAFTILALVGFAANSLLCRAALSNGAWRIDAASFTLIRLSSGAVVLGALVWRRGPKRQGSWLSTAMLFLYAAGFSLAYVRIPAALGALVLFGAVQVTMIGVGILRGERPTAQEWVGLAIAFAALVALIAPGVSAPDPLGAALMAAAGVAWGVYSLRGRGSLRPLAATADNFLRSVPLAVVASAVMRLGGAPLRILPSGAALAVLSGALASGLGYSLWYAALPRLTATRGAIVQLAVPVLAAAGGVVLLGERLSLRLVAAGSTLLFGILVSVLARPRRASDRSSVPAEQDR